MRIIIVDDEPKGISLLESYLNYFPQLELAGTFRNGLKAFAFLQQQPVEVLFLDINMPHLSGISLAKMIPTTTKIIFTTAHAEYAVESYELPAFDYLLKPISFDRFTQAVNRLLAPATADNPSPAESLLWIKSGSDTYRIKVNDVYFLEKDGNYLYYHLADRKIMARESAAEALAKLPVHFVQVHKSFLINCQHIESFNKQEVVIQGKSLPIGPRYRAAFAQRVQW